MLEENDSVAAPLQFPPLPPGAATPLVVEIESETAESPKAEEAEEEPVMEKEMRSTLGAEPNADEEEES